MACYSYTLINTGPEPVGGHYTRDSDGNELSWTCNRNQQVILQGVRGNEITSFNPVYYEQYVIEKRGSECSPPPASVCTLAITEVQTTPNTNSGLTFPNGTATIVTNDDVNISLYEFSIDGQIWQASPTFGGMTAIVSYIAYARKKADTTCYAQLAFTVPKGVPALFASMQTTRHPTTVGGADGEIEVKIISGSGNYTVKFLHDNITYDLSTGAGYQVMLKLGLVAGEYSALVTDLANGQNMTLKALVSNPVVVPVEQGSFLDVPMMNSLHWVREDLAAPQTPDNRLLINQRYPGYAPCNYFNPYLKTDFITTIFNTDYAYARAELFKHGTLDKVKTFPAPILKIKNLGETGDFAIQIMDHTEPTQSRVYFAAGSPPIPLAAGVPFEILDSNTDFDGVYTPVAVQIDPNTGYEYAVISKLWAQEAGTEFVSATGRFNVTAVDFDVYEIIHTFEDVEYGCYYLVLTAYDDASADVWISEPINIEAAHPNTLLIKYRNIDNAFGIAFATGYTGVIRIPAILGHKRRPGGERTMSRNSDWSLVKVSARKQRVFDLETFMLPPYMHEKLSVLFDCDYWTINKVQYQASEGYADPGYVYKFLLANSSIRVEQTPWLDKYNSDDIGTVGETNGGFLAAQGGLLRV